MNPDSETLPLTVRPELQVVYWSAAAVTAHLLESGLPYPGPWFKPGLANIFVLVAWMQLGWRAAIGVALLRVFASSLIMGTFFSPTFFLGLSGALAALLTMGVLGLTRLRIGPVGLSIPASLAHMTAQVFVAQELIIGHPGVFTALPWFLIGSWITGLFNGLVACFILQRLERGGLANSQEQGKVNWQRGSCASRE
ncbi:MAG: Gx transporter family protein [Magnetococcales bacterium]|nr:Gx transporter family protein [Magnetococcales bacterium]MBF0418668.1 Gx transporter family protein [Magnetococcales bacterium]MBF0434038.1 Gx transporter family protein [Magnetococcales bacterium]